MASSGSRGREERDAHARRTRTGTRSHVLVYDERASLLERRHAGRLAVIDSSAASDDSEDAAAGSFHLSGAGDNTWPASHSVSLYVQGNRRPVISIDGGHPLPWILDYVLYVSRRTRFSVDCRRLTTARSRVLQPLSMHHAWSLQPAAAIIILWCCNCECGVVHRARWAYFTAWIGPSRSYRRGRARVGRFYRWVQSSVLKHTGMEGKRQKLHVQVNHQ